MTVSQTEKGIPTSLQVPPEVWEAVATAATKRRCSKQEIWLDAVRSYLGLDTAA